jgi:hypothetical protein
MTKKYRVLAKSFIGNALREEGDVVEYDGKPGSNLELIQEEKPSKGKGKQEAAEKVSEEASGDAV